MINKIYVNDLIDYLYEEGNKDLISFGQLLGIVTYDQNDDSFGKKPIQRLEDALLLASFLVNSGDFDCVVYTKNPDSTFCLSSIADGVQGLAFLTRKRFELGGIDDLELVSGFWLRKLSFGNKRPTIGEDIYFIFSTR